jgi:hypothetical protein
VENWLADTDTRSSGGRQFSMDVHQPVISMALPSAQPFASASRDAWAAES